MEMERANQNRALVKHTGKQDAVAFGLGAAGVGLALLTSGFWPIALGIGTVLMSWEKVTSVEKRTTVATAAFVLGTLPLVLGTIHMLSGFLSGLFFLILVAAVTGGIYYGVTALGKKRDKKE